jgi:hypothetical protein
MNVISKCDISFEVLNKIEEKFYKIKDYNREKCIVRNFLNIMEKIVNESIRFDLQYRTNEKV